MASILIIDDDQMFCDIMGRMIEKLGHDSQAAYTGSSGVAMAQSDFFDVVFLDINLPDANGLGLISAIKAVPSVPEIIIITGDSDPDGAEMAIHSGAWGYIEKPFRQHKISLELSRVLQYRKEKGVVPTTGRLNRKGIIGRDSRIKSCLEKIPDAAYSDNHVLIYGEVGTGKKLFARTIHLNSIRSDHQFVIVECATLTEATAWQRLIGGTESTFPGSGLLMKAHNGTLFLQEVDCLPQKIQQLFVDLLSDRTAGPEKDKSTVESNFKVIASSTRDLKALAERGQFSPDLLALLDTVQIHLPPLRGRGQDITSIALFYIQKYCAARSLDNKGVTPEFLDIITHYSWPENVKELSHAMEDAVVSARNEPTMYSIHLPSHIKSQAMKNPVPAAESRPAAPVRFEDSPPAGYGIRSVQPDATVPPFDISLPPLKTAMETAEKTYLKKLMNHAGQDIDEACRIAGISKSSLYKRKRKYSM